MPKSPRQVYACAKCGAQYPRWTGRCSECGVWGSVAEGSEAEQDERPSRLTGAKKGVVQPFASLKAQNKGPVQSSGLTDIDRILGGGFVAGSVTLVGGEPGVGKSTLLAQVALNQSADGKRVLYVTGEESPSQVALRLQRMASIVPPSLAFLDATDASVIAGTIQDEGPELTIVDSVQSLRLQDIPGEAGNMSQVKASAAVITEAAKRANVPVVLVGQVNKEGDIAGPRLLEHLVDTVLMLEGEPQHQFRILRAIKHRFGPVDEVAVYRMKETGLEPVLDPSAELLRDRPNAVSGSVVTCLLEGHRPLLLELQALVSPAGYGTPVRRTAGVDLGRLGLLLAVLARRAGVNALDKDVYANAAGGLKAKEPAADLALCLAIASAVSDVSIPSKTAVFGEIGLGGEVRPVALPDMRVKEAERHGFTTILLPKGSEYRDTDMARILEVGTLREAIQKALGG